MKIREKFMEHFYFEIFVLRKRIILTFLLIFLKIFLPIVL